MVIDIPATFPILLQDRYELILYAKDHYYEIARASQLYYKSTKK